MSEWPKGVVVGGRVHFGGGESYPVEPTMGVSHARSSEGAAAGMRRSHGSFTGRIVRPPVLAIKVDRIPTLTFEVSIEKYDPELYFWVQDILQHRVRVTLDIVPKDAPASQNG